MISKEKLRLALAVLYTIQVFISSFLAFNSPFISVNITEFIITHALIHFAFGFYLFNLKNVVGWWRKQWFLARARVDFKRKLREKYEREVGYGYDKLK